MIHISEKMRSAFHVINALIWIFLVVVSWTKIDTLAAAGLFSSVLLVTLYFMMGASKGEHLALRTFIYPILATMLIWIATFWIILATRGTASTNFILGMHPGMAAATLIFWVGNFLTITLSYIVLFKDSLSDKDWENFEAEIKKFQKIH